RLLDGEIGEAARYSASSLANDDLLHFQGGRKALADGFSLDAGISAADQQALNLAAPVRLVIDNAGTVERHDFRGAWADNLRSPFPPRAAAAKSDPLGDRERFVVNARRNEDPVTGRREINCTLNRGKSIAGHTQCLWSTALLRPKRYCAPVPDQRGDEQDDGFLHGD